MDKKPGPGEYGAPQMRSSKLACSFKSKYPDKVSDTPGPHEYADKDFCRIYMCACKSRGFSFGLKPRPATREVVPGPQYQVGASTLGIAAAGRVKKEDMGMSVVL